MWYAFKPVASKRECRCWDVWVDSALDPDSRVPELTTWNGGQGPFLNYRGL